MWTIGFKPCFDPQTFDQCQEVTLVHHNHALVAIPEKRGNALLAF